MSSGLVLREEVMSEVRVNLDEPEADGDQGGACLDPVKSPSIEASGPG